MVTVVRDIQIQTVRGEACRVIEGRRGPSVSADGCPVRLIVFEEENEVSFDIGDVHPSLRIGRKAGSLLKRTEAFHLNE